jgi:hypothetical protein
MAKAKKFRFDGPPFLPLWERNRKSDGQARARRGREDLKSFTASFLSSAIWFYKKGCQEKKLSHELEAAKSIDIQPLCRCAGASRRSSACVISPVK